MCIVHEHYSANIFMSQTVLCEKHTGILAAQDLRLASMVTGQACELGARSMGIGLC